MTLHKNAVGAEADRITISLMVEGRPGVLKIVISDNGRGMEPDLLDRVTDPFTTSRKTRHVGLGIP